MQQIQQDWTTIKKFSYYLAILLKLARTLYFEFHPYQTFYSFEFIIGPNGVATRAFSLTVSMLAHISTISKSTIRQRLATSWKSEPATAFSWNGFIWMRTNKLFILYIHQSLSESDRNQERMLNYERYRTLVQNEAAASNQSILFFSKQAEIKCLLLYRGIFRIIICSSRLTWTHSEKNNKVLKFLDIKWFILNES